MPTPRVPVGWTITTELSGVCCVGIMPVTPQEIAGMGRFQAHLVDGQNAERASSQCLFACLQLEDTVTGELTKIGCDASCDNWFGCTHPKQSGGTRHCCEFTNQGQGRVKDAASYTGYVATSTIQSVALKSRRGRSPTTMLSASWRQTSRRPFRGGGSCFQTS